MGSFDDYKGILPYASELFGIYQPLLGWKSQIIQKRYERFRSSLYAELAARTLVTARTPVQIKLNPRDVLANAASGASFEISNLAPIDLTAAAEIHVSDTIDSGIARMIAHDLGAEPPKDWKTLISPRRIDERLKKLKDILSNPGQLQRQPELKDYVENFSRSVDVQGGTQALLQELFAKEAKIGGYLLFLSQHTPSNLTNLFYRRPASALLTMAQAADPLLNFGANNYRAILSPIGIIHLYREYFFEFNSFLGPPVGHVWLSPGGTVELDRSQHAADADREIAGAVAGNDGQVGIRKSRPRTTSPMR